MHCLWLAGRTVSLGLRSVFLSGSQRKKVTAFMQGPTANYNSQSAEGQAAG